MHAYAYTDVYMRRSIQIYTTVHTNDRNRIKIEMPSLDRQAIAPKEHREINESYEEFKATHSKT